MWSRAIGHLEALFGPLLRDTRGAAAIMIAAGLIPLVGAAGLMVDSSLGYLLRSRMSKALDTAGLAAGRIALDADAAEIAREYFDVNFSNQRGSTTITDFSFELDETRQFVTLSADATAPTVFMRIFGKDRITVNARTVIERKTTGIELALVLDNTGSMRGNKFNTMRAAAYDLIDIIYGDESEIENVWISLVPYTSTVNIGNWRANWLSPVDRVLLSLTHFLTAGWKGCVMARPAPLDSGDAPPGASPFTSYFWRPSPDNNWLLAGVIPNIDESSDRQNAGTGPNLGCGPAIQPLTASRAAIDAAIGNMAPWHRGGTAGNLGLSWGWRTISPRWRGLWGGDTPATHPLDYGTPLMEKVVVILTDGQNQFYDLPVAEGGDPATPSDFTAYGRVNDALGAATIGIGRNRLDTRMARTCADMKAEGIRIYSITFGPGPDAHAQTLFRNCASHPAMYFHAPNNADLTNAFKAIGGELANLRIVE